MKGHPGEIGGECVYSREPGISKWKIKRQFIKFSNRHTISIRKATSFIRSVRQSNIHVILRKIDFETI